MGRGARGHARAPRLGAARRRRAPARRAPAARRSAALDRRGRAGDAHVPTPHRSEEHTSELQSLRHLVCRLLLEKKKKKKKINKIHNKQARPIETNTRRKS